LSDGGSSGISCVVVEVTWFTSVNKWGKWGKAKDQDEEGEKNDYSPGGYVLQIHMVFK